MGARDPAAAADRTAPPAWTAFEWYRLAVELDGVKPWNVRAARVGESQLGEAVGIVMGMWALVDPVVRWLMAARVSASGATVGLMGSVEDRLAIQAAIQGTAPAVDEPRRQIALVEVSELCFAREEDLVSPAGLPSLEAEVHLAAPSVAADEAVRALEREFLASNDDPTMVLVDEYRWVELSSPDVQHGFLMSRRGSDWYVVFWPSLWRSLVGLPNPPTEPRGGPSGVREPVEPLPPHRSGGATLDLPWG